jgi:Zn-dependent peptidase ImmA (M78 family)
MQALTLSPEVLRWAADQAGESLESLVRALVKRERDQERLVRGELTPPQAEKLAKLTGVPFGLLFLPSPPTIARPPIPDLRQTLDPAPLSRDFLEVWDDVSRKQLWYRDRLIELGATPLPFVGRFKDAASRKPDIIARDMTAVMGLTAQIRATARSADEYFTAVADRAEAAGVLVMKSGIVKSNTRRPLSVKEFRGFAIVDSMAPTVFVNGRDAIVANVFTLVHELAHVWLGESGVSDLATRAAKGVERVCNQVAAEVLVPKQEFLAQWRVQTDLGQIARLFRVSKLVIARRALDFDLIDADAYEAVASATNQPARAGGGGSAYRTIPARNSKRLTLALVSSALSGETLLREAASLLAVRPETVMELGKRLATRG